MALFKYIVLIIIAIQIWCVFYVMISLKIQTQFKPISRSDNWLVISFFNKLTGKFEFPEEYFQRILTDNPYLLTADNVTGFPDYIVPNYIHLIRMNQTKLTFVDLVCLLAAYRHQNPEKIMIHCDDCNFQGHYWEKAKSMIPVLETKYFDPPKTIYGKKLANKWHAGDVARIKLLQKYGGIFLDNDVYLVQNLDRFRKFEMTLDWDEGEYKGTQVLIAHPRARYLELWKQTYLDYRGDLWYYNAGQLPTKAILWKHPEIIHRVKELFGVRLRTSGSLYTKDNPNWKDYYSYHLLLRWVKNLIPSHIKEFNETNIRNYNRTFGRMARLMYYGSEDLILNKKTELSLIENISFAKSSSTAITRKKYLNLTSSITKES